MNYTKFHLYKGAYSKWKLFTKIQLNKQIICIWSAEETHLRLLKKRFYKVWLICYDCYENQDWSVSIESSIMVVFSITLEDWSCWVCIGCISDFFFSLRITCRGITSSRKLPPFHTDAETFSTWKITCNSYDKKMGTVSAMVATVNKAWNKMYMNMRFWSPSKPLKRHQRLFAFSAFFESSLQNQEVRWEMYRYFDRERESWPPVRSHDFRIS